MNLKEAFASYELEPTDTELGKFEQFLELFKETNSQINLSAIRDDAGIIEKHFIDSCMLAAFAELNSPSIPLEWGGSESKWAGGAIRVADLGTGGGFPGIPLAITHPDVEFTLIDSVAKKLRCVDDFSEKLWLKNVKTLAGRAEEIGQNKEYRESFDFVVSRATAYFPTLLEYVIPLLKVGGVFAAYKLDDKDELKSARKALVRLGAKIEVVKNYRLGEQKRTIVFIVKIRNTDKKYPRKVGVPLKAPIV